jgi:hypothetical protein
MPAIRRQSRYVRNLYKALTADERSNLPLGNYRNDPVELRVSAVALTRNAWFSRSVLAAIRRVIYTTNTLKAYQIRKQTKPKGGSPAYGAAEACLSCKQADRRTMNPSDAAAASDGRTIAQHFG